MNTVIREFEVADCDAVREVLLSAFPEDTEAELVLQLRWEGDTLAELVAEADGRLIGHICFSRFVSPVGYAALAPVAVVPDAQGRGTGSLLIRRGLEAVAAAGAYGVVVLGEPAYYGRFGFEVDAAAALESEYPKEYLQALHFGDRGPFAKGTPLRYPAAFGQADAAGDSDRNQS